MKKLLLALAITGLMGTEVENVENNVTIEDVNVTVNATYCYDIDNLDNLDNPLKEYKTICFTGEKPLGDFTNAGKEHIWERVEENVKEINTTLMAFNLSLPEMDTSYTVSFSKGGN